MSSEPNTVQSLPPFFTPSSVVEGYNNAIKIENEAFPIKIQGIYQPDSSNRLYAGYYYDSLIEEGGTETLTMKVKPIIRQALVGEKGKLISIVGMLSRKIQPTKSCLQIIFTPSFVISSQKSTISNDERRLAELSAAKSNKGYKGVRLMIKQLLFENKKPTIALLWSTQSVVRTEFSNALSTAVSSFEFTNIDTTFSNVAETTKKLRELDGKFDIVALIRGGGSNLEVFSHPDMIETIVNMNSGTISAVGHAEEKHLLKKVADLAVDTPTALGKFFSDVVEETVSERTKSKAILYAEVEKTFKEHINKQDVYIKQAQEQNKKLEAQNYAQIEQGKQRDNVLQNIQQTLAEKDKAAREANDRIRELTDKLQASAHEQSKQIATLTNPLTEQINRLSQEAEARSKELTVKTDELISKNQELSALRSRPQNVTTTQALVIATCALIAGVILSALLF